MPRPCSAETVKLLDAHRPEAGREVFVALSVDLVHRQDDRRARPMKDLSHLGIGGGPPALGIDDKDDDVRFFDGQQVCRIAISKSVSGSGSRPPVSISSTCRCRISACCRGGHG